MPFVKQDMSFIHYRWDSEHTPPHLVFSGEPSRRVFDPFNGDQVLFLINFCASLMDPFSIKGARLLENKIAHQLPPELKSERSVFNWIMQDLEPVE